MMSPWLQASQTASGPADAAIRASHSRTAAPPGLRAGQRLPLRAGEHRRGRVGLHDLPQRVLGQLLERPAGPVAVPAPRPAGRRPSHRRLRPAGTAAAVSTQRSSGLVTTAASGTGASRSATAAACARPRSSRCTPGVRPGQHRPGHRGEAVPDEQDRGHPATLECVTAAGRVRTCPCGRRGEHRHRPGGAGRQPGDRGRQDRRRADRRVERDAGRGRALRRRHHQPGLPAHLAAAVPQGSRTRPTRSGTARSGSSGPCWPRSASSSPARCSRSTRACTGCCPASPRSPATCSRTPCCSSRSWPRAPPG